MINDNDEIIDDINIYDLNNEEEESGRNTNFHNLFKHWDEIISQYNWNNDIYHKMLLHVLLGQVLKKIKINKGGNSLDGRISFMLIQPQGTGKDAPISIFEKICSRIEEEASKLLNMKNSNITLRCKRLDEFSDASIIGSVYSYRIENSDKWVTKKIEGAISKSVSDIIIIKEGRKILGSQKTGESSAVQYFNLALEPIYSNNKIVKNLIGGVVECESEMSLLMTSFPTTLIDKEILYSGFFRRVITFYNPMNLKELNDNLDKGINKFIENKTYEKEISNSIISSENILIQILSTALANNQLNEKGEFNFSFIIDDNAKYKMKELSEKYYKIEKIMANEQGRLLYSFVDSYINSAIIIASHRAFINAIDLDGLKTLKGEIYITKYDVEYGIDLIDKNLESMIKFIDFVYKQSTNFYKLKDIDDEKEFKKILSHLMNNKNDWYEQNLIVQKIISYSIENGMKYSYKKIVYEKLRNLKSEGLIEVLTSGGKQKIRICY